MEQNDSLIGRAAAAIEEVMAGLERENGELLGFPPSLVAATDRRVLAEIIARALHGQGMLHDPNDKLPIYRVDR